MTEPFIPTENIIGNNSIAKPKIAVVIPCYKVSEHIGKVLQGIGPDISQIYCVDDCCPENSGQKAKQKMQGDNRLCVLTRKQNGGVGAAVLTGYKAAIENGADIIVKLDGDGQMDPGYIPQFVTPIIDGDADYVKGNRFYHINNLKSMPWKRIIGNAGLSFFSKISTGYWNLFDPTNGFTAIHSSVVRELRFEKIHPRFFFESDMFLQLYLLRAVVLEVPMNAIYAHEKSNLNVWKALFLFPFFHIRNLAIRLFYSYFLRDFSIASLNLLFGSMLFLFGIIFGLKEWLTNSHKEILTSPGTVMLAALPIILGFQLLAIFLSYDMSNIPREPVYKRLNKQGR